jgi:hypothetical protein
MSELLPQKSWRHWLRFSVRTLMIVLALFACTIGWLVHSAQVQRDAVEAIEATSGAVSYVWQYKDGDEISNGRPWAPKWLVDLLGVDYFGSIALVYLGDEATEAVMGHVGHLKNLERLSLCAQRGKHVTDSWLTHLRGLTRLKDLILFNTAITDAGLVHLEELTSLEWLDLTHTKITDAGLAHLKNLASLKELDLFGTQVSDAGLVHLKSLKKLETLNVEGTSVTDAGIKEMRKILRNLIREYP